MLKDRQELRGVPRGMRQSLQCIQEKDTRLRGHRLVSSRSLNIYARLRELIEAKGIHCAVELEHEPESEGVALKKSGCHWLLRKRSAVRSSRRAGSTRR